MREWPTSRQSTDNGDNRAQSSSVAPPDRDTPRGSNTDTRGRTKFLYAINSHKKEEEFPDVVSRIIQVFDFTVYALVYLGAR